MYELLLIRMYIACKLTCISVFVILKFCCVMMHVVVLCSVLVVLLKLPRSQNGVLVSYNARLVANICMAPRN